MAVSPNNEFLSMFASDGHLYVVTIDFLKVIADFKTNAEQPPSILAWFLVFDRCGNDAVVMHWDDIILMVGPQGDFLKFPYDGTVHIITEIDSCRIISSTKCEIIQRVSQSQENVFKFGSTAASAILFEARDLYDVLIIN